VPGKTANSAASAVMAMWIRLNGLLLSFVHAMLGAAQRGRQRAWRRGAPALTTC
jgi:hypothetical protein